MYFVWQTDFERLPSAQNENQVHAIKNLYSTFPSTRYYLIIQRKVSATKKSLYHHRRARWHFQEHRTTNRDRGTTLVWWWVKVGRYLSYDDDAMSEIVKFVFTELISLDSSAALRCEWTRCSRVVLTFQLCYSGLVGTGYGTFSPAQKFANKICTFQLFFTFRAQSYRGRRWLERAN